jgi:ubiquinone/menaquinone biosynthesis C-methylase UbiE
MVTCQSKVDPMQVEKVRSYFDRMAPEYGNASTKFPWSWIRNSEARSVFNMLNSVRGKDVLELGCGAGFYSEKLLSAGANHVWAVDVSQEMLDQILNPRVKKICSDAALVRLDKRFPLAISMGLFEFVKDSAAVLNNMARHIEKDGSILVLHPTASGIGSLYRLFHRLNGLEINIFSKGELEDLADEAGLCIVATDRCGLFSTVSELRFRP